MLKMFTTQISGLFKRIMDAEEFSFEDSARLLAQASIGDGTIYIQGFGEMKGIVSEAMDGQEPFPNARPLDEIDLINITLADRVLLFARHSTDEDAIKLARQLQDSRIPFTAVSTVIDSSDESLQELADVHIDLRLQKGLLPDETGNRIGFPSLMAALYVYNCLKFTLEEILTEFEELD
ncbi:DUF2529 domain-containing protein [Peribacillus sp. SCS-155]|uniref:DUF2529 domain-containing protein n=1 Tax=Peribacillus sedimenti TaxID=3115297 RepID=UPI0039066FCD